MKYLNIILSLALREAIKVLRERIAPKDINTDSDFIGLIHPAMYAHKLRIYVDRCKEKGAWLRARTGEWIRSGVFDEFDLPNDKFFEQLKERIFNYGIGDVSKGEIMSKVLRQEKLFTFKGL